MTALVAVLLPFVGAAIRAIAFGAAGLQDPLDLAVEDGVPGLGATAIKAVALTAIGVPIVTLYSYWRWRRRPAEPFEGAWKWIRRGVILAILVLGTLFVPPGSAVNVFAGLGGGVVVSNWARGHSLTFYRAAAVALVLAAVSALAAGLSGMAVGDEVNAYSFEAGSGINDGNFVQLGDNGAFFYLDSCSGQGLEVVNHTVVVRYTTATALPPHTPLLVDVLFHGEPIVLGYRRAC